jgi:Flp pilus assembly protein TadD
MENLKLLLQIYFRPAAVMSDLMDHGNWLAAAAIVVVVSIAFFFTINTKLDEKYRVPTFNEYYRPAASEADDEASEAEYRKAADAYQTALANRPRIPLVDEYFYKFFSFEPAAFYRPVLSLSIFYVPFAILLMSLFGGTSFGLALRRDYGTLALCTLTAWAAGHMPFAIAGILLYSLAVPPETYLGLWAASGLLFGIFMIFALRVSMGANYGPAILVVCFAWLVLSLGMYAFKYISPWLFSPFILFYGYMYFGGQLRGEARGMGNAFRQRQNFKRFLNNATVNPKDADAHLQLGLIYMQRRQEAKAIEHFNKAFEIDNSEIDANYELGKVARVKGDLQGALNHFSVVIEQNDKHSLSEVWREIGATYLAAGMFDEAEKTLDTFVERRAFDPEGLYYLGKTLKFKGETEKARDLFERAIESAKTSPVYRRRDIKNWVRLAQKEI